MQGHEMNHVSEFLMLWDALMTPEVFIRLHFP